jgi:ribosome modulation factor
MEGCSAGWASQPITSLPYRHSPQREAWAAGWNWAQTQPDRRDPARDDSNGAIVRHRAAERRRHLVSAAKGGALSLTILAAARWLGRSR